ncbi:jg18967 [Pararge aegeria aegeria]|uniref:Jg18967 protein n=1 Tax=Pararge aegeria aegeria TaxID=348720 RepID=A0A8S4SQE4_9NEOP|nr:jg18967 [Pararge aegeria aegeria]
MRASPSRFALPPHIRGSYATSISIEISNSPLLLNISNNSKIYFEKSIRHPNPLIVAASFYSPNLSATLNKRRPKHILHDPDDQITTDNAPYQNIFPCTASSTAKTRSTTSNVNRTWARTTFSEACGLITVRNPFTPIVA